MPRGRRGSIGKGKKKGKPKTKKEKTKWTLARISEGGEERESLEEAGEGEAKAGRPGDEGRLWKVAEEAEGREGIVQPANTDGDNLEGGKRGNEYFNKQSKANEVISNDQSEGSQEKLPETADEAKTPSLTKKRSSEEERREDREGENQSETEREPRRRGSAAPAHASQKFRPDFIPRDSLRAESSGWRGDDIMEDGSAGEGSVIPEEGTSAAALPIPPHEKTTNTNAVVTTKTAEDGANEKLESMHRSSSPPEILRRDAGRFTHATPIENRLDDSLLLDNLGYPSKPLTNQDAPIGVTQGKMPVYPFKDVFHSTPEQQDMGKMTEPVRRLKC